MYWDFGGRFRRSARDVVRIECSSSVRVGLFSVRAKASQTRRREVGDDRQRIGRVSAGGWVRAGVQGGKLLFCEGLGLGNTNFTGQETTTFAEKQRQPQTIATSATHFILYNRTRKTTAMTENAPPGSANAASDAASRGMPYYERLRRDLRESLQKKRILDNNLVRTEDGAS